MTNTNNILLMAAITSLLIMGTSMIPMQSYADSGSNDENKNYDDSKSKTGATSQTDKKSANQHMGQDNFCYRGNEICTQANEGQQLVGEDNEAAGFNDQSDNLALSSSSTGTGTSPTPTPTPTPTTPRTCEECFTSILTPEQILIVQTAFERNFEEICQTLNEGRTLTSFVERFFPPFIEFQDRIPFTTVLELIECLKDAGIVFAPE